MIFEYHRHVNYYETDMMGIVHHSVYAIWFEQARTEIFRANGIPFSQFEAEGYHSPLLSIETQFIKPCRYGEIVDVHLQLSQVLVHKVKMSFAVLLQA